MNTGGWCGGPIDASDPQSGGGARLAAPAGHRLRSRGPLGRFPAFRRILGPMRLELTKRGDYAVRAMLALTRGAGNGLLSARRISDAMDIPVRFLPQVLADLQHAGLVEAAPGRAGGYRLAREPGRVSLLDVIEAVEGESRHPSCVLRGGPCGEDGYCDVHRVFSEGREALRGRFARTSLAELARREPAIRAGVAADS